MLFCSLPFKCQQAPAGAILTKAEQQFCSYLEFRLNRLRQQAMWSDKINTVIICSRRFFLQLFHLKLADYQGGSFTLGLLQRNLLYIDSPFWHVTNVTSIPMHERVCVCTRVFTSLVSFQLCLLLLCFLLCACWYLYVYILYIPAPSSGYSTNGSWTHWPVLWNYLPRQELWQ